MPTFSTMNQKKRSHDAVEASPRGRHGQVAARTPGCDVGRKNDVGVFRLHKSSAFADDFIPLKMTIEK
jgi:hypothetical protein